jgi:hypothetical protein
MPSYGLMAFALMPAKANKIRNVRRVGIAAAAAAAAYGLWLMAYGLWLMAYGLCLMQ